MRLRINWVLVLLVVVAMFVCGWTALGQRQVVTPTQWEYTVKHTGTIEKTPTVLNELGAQGWELVNVTHEGWAYFKRQKR
ncbi:MAG: DUF4177 domain-containing protein [Acidobacteria bacterium]|nr:DUF4177 domain-containing protein [Acidobacteriota bacterium]